MPMKPSGFLKNKTVSFLFRAIRVFAVLGTATAVAVFLISLKAEPEKTAVKDILPGVTVLTVHPETRVMTVEAFGTVKPRKSVNVAVEVPGRIIHLHPSFIEGGQIKKEEPVARIDPRSYELELSASRVRVRQARLDIENFEQDVKNLRQDIVLSEENLELVRKELERVKTLTRNQFASQNSRDRAEQAYLQAKMQFQSLSNRLLLTDTRMTTKKAALSMAEVDVQKAALALERTRIQLEFDGLVLEKSAEVGEYVNPGQILGVVYEAGKLDVDVRIPIEKMRWIKGLSESRALPGVKIQMTRSDGPVGSGWTGRVARLKAGIDERTRTLPLTIEIDPPGPDHPSFFHLKPGAFVTCTIIGESVDNLFVLPRHLLKTGDIIFTVRDGRLKMKRVTVFRKFEEEIYISDGLVPGEEVVSSPLPGAVEGMAVSVRNPAGETGSR